MKTISFLKMFVITLCITNTLLACTNNTPQLTVTTTQVTGQAFAASGVSGRLSVSDDTGKTLTTANINQGRFSVAINNSDLSKPLIFTVTGTYTDYIAGAAVTLNTSNPLAIQLPEDYFSAAQNEATIVITPATTLLHHLLQNGQSLTAATTTFAQVFGYQPSTTAQPFDPYTTTRITNQTQADQDASFRIAIFSQLANHLGLNASDLASFPAQLAADLSDGVWDGVNHGNPVLFASSGINLQQLHHIKPLANRLNMAIAQFTANAINRAGITPPNMGLPPMVADAPGSTKNITLTNGMSIDVTLTTANTAPFQSGFRSAKTTHNITLRDAATGMPIDITAGGFVNSLMMMPRMFMYTGHEHSTPHSMVNTMQAAAGIYTLDTYYLMASSMNNMSMGQWQLDIQLGDSTSASMVDPYAHSYFFPNVIMNMGNDQLRHKVQHTADQWTNMMGMTIPREYSVWLHDIRLNPAGGHDLTVFISTRDMTDIVMAGGMVGMNHYGMNFPAVHVGQTLHNPVNAMGMRPATTIATLTLEASTDAGVTWSPMTALPMMMPTGQYNIVGLAGLTSGLPATIDMRLTINGNPMLDAGSNNPQLSFTAP